MAASVRLPVERRPVEFPGESFPPCWTVTGPAIRPVPPRVEPLEMMAGLPADVDPETISRLETTLVVPV